MNLFEFITVLVIVAPLSILACAFLVACIVKVAKGDWDEK